MTTPLEINNQKIRKKSLKKKKYVFGDSFNSSRQFLMRPRTNSSPNKKIKIFAICLLAVAGLSLTLALLKVSGVIFKPVKTEAMKGSESKGGRYLKEESHWQRYGVSPEGLVLWLDQSDPRSYGNSANWYDMSGQGNHGTQTTADYQPGIVSGSGFAGFARDFDGSDDYILVNNSSVFNTTYYTISFWMKTDGIWGTNGGSPSNTACIIARVDAVGSFNGFSITQNPTSGIISLTLKAAASASLNLSSTSNLTNNEWYHVAVTFNQNNGGTGIIYVNGNNEAQGTNSSAWSFNNQNLYIADSADTWWEEWAGIISDVRIYNRALTAAEIQKLYLADKPRYGGM